MLLGLLTVLHDLENVLCHWNPCYKKDSDMFMLNIGEMVLKKTAMMFTCLHEIWMNVSLVKHSWHKNSLLNQFVARSGLTVHVLI